MTENEREEILEKYKEWFRESLIIAHKKNTEKLVDIEEFNINPFLVFYLAKFFKGNTTSKSVAEILLYPRVLGTSITTSFGQGMQKFVSQILGAYGSTTSGIDIEFIDQVDKRRKYCQLKSGPNAINKDDVITIDDHFNAVKNLARTNNVRLEYGDLVFALTYGESSEINSFIKKLQDKNITVYVGKEFWHRFTGHKDFYEQLIAASAIVAKDKNITPILHDIVDKLSIEVEKKYKDYYRDELDKKVDN